MLAHGLPRCLILVLCMLAYMDNVEHCVGDVDACEIFCGVGSLTSALRSLDYIVANADIAMGSCFDVTKAAGFLACVLIVRRVRRKGLSFFAPLCSSFCYLNLGTSGRQGYMLPGGVTSEPSTRNANLIANRTCALVRIAICLDQIPLVEQPNHKRGLIALRRWQDLLRDHNLYRQSCKQGAYGAETEKPTGLFSTHPRWHDLRNNMLPEDRARVNECNKQLVVRKRDNMGNVKLTGVRKASRSTQNYTGDFGMALAPAFSRGCVTDASSPAYCALCDRDEPPTMFETLGEPYEEEKEIGALFDAPIDMWEDCEIVQVISYLRESWQLNLPPSWPADF